MRGGARGEGGVHGGGGGVVGGQQGRGLRSVGREGLVGVEMLVMVVVNIRYSQLSQAPQTEGGVAQSCAEHIHRTEMGLTDQPGSTEVLYFQVLSKRESNVLCLIVLSDTYSHHRPQHHC